MAASYISVADATTYFSTRLNSQPWEEADPADQLKALYTATRQIENLNFIGCPTEDDQELHFPVDDETTIPLDIQYATAELALALLDGADPEIERANLDMTSQTYGKTSASYDRKNRPLHIMAGIVSVQAWNLLSKYLADPHSIRLRRSS